MSLKIMTVSKMTRIRMILGRVTISRMTLCRMTPLLLKLPPSKNIFIKTVMPNLNKTINGRIITKYIWLLNLVKTP